MGRNSSCAAVVLSVSIGVAVTLLSAAPRSDVRPGSIVKLNGNTPVTAPAATQAVPDASAQAKAERAIRDLFKTEYAATSDSDRQAFARKLLQQGLETRDDLASRFVLMNQAYEIAVASADTATALRVVDELARVYPINVGDKMIATLDALNHAANTQPDVEAIGRATLPVVRSIAARDDYELARKLAIRAQAIVNRMGRTPLGAQFQDCLKELQEQQKEYELFRKATATLQQKPNDPDAILVVGKFNCFAKSAWERGLPQLAASNDVVLKRLAEQDLGKPLDAPTQYELANGWWDVAEKQPHIFAAQIKSHAAMWYRSAGARLSGMQQTSAQRRVQEADAAQMKLLSLEPGLSSELFSDKDFSHSSLTRVDKDINFDWGLGAPAEGLPKDDFSIRWTGQILVHTPGKYTLVVFANAGARLTIDEKQILNNDSMTRKRNGEHVAVEFAEGLHSIRLEFWDSGGEANMKLLWIPPGAKTEEPIPSFVLFH